MAFVNFVVFPFDLLFLIYCMFEKNGKNIQSFK